MSKGKTMSDKLQINVIEVMVDKEPKFYCTFVSSELIFEYGLSAKVIVGEVDKSEDEEFDFATSFRANPAFKETIFDFARAEMLDDETLINSAIEQQEGWVYIIDQRTKTPEGEVPPYDIIGGFKVENKELKRFSENPNYQIKSINGFTDLGKNLNIKMNIFLENLVLTKKK